MKKIVGWIIVVLFFGLFIVYPAARELGLLYGVSAILCIIGLVLLLRLAIGWITD